MPLLTQKHAKYLEQYLEQYIDVQILFSLHRQLSMCTNLCSSVVYIKMFLCKKIQNR